MREVDLSILRNKIGFIYLLTIIACFLVFKQSDLTHTYTSSYAYLSGHFSDFYDYNYYYVGGNDYLPSLYVIFAIWNIPLKLLGLIPDNNAQPWMLTTPTEIIWSKLLLTLFFVACILVLDRISRLISKEFDYKGVNAGALFATSPFIIFGVFIYSQYDVIGVFFTLLGFYFYLNKRFVYFSLLFSISISFKYFAFIIYVPLILLIEKRIIFLIGYLLLGLLVTIVEIGFYWHSEIFIKEFFSLAGGKTGEAMRRSSAFYFAAMYALMCFYAFFSKPPHEDFKKVWYRNAILMPTFSYALMFSIVRWHPHWLVVLAPFTCLCYTLLQKQKWLARIEIAAYIGFVIICFNTWERNADITMVFNGIFGAFIPKTDMIGRDILGSQFMGISRALFYLYLYSPFILLCYCSRFELIKNLLVFFGRENNSLNSLKNSQFQGLGRDLLYGRAFLGTMFIVFIAIMCILWPYLATLR